MEQEVQEVQGEQDDRERLDYLVVPEVDDTYDPLDGDIPNLENAGKTFNCFNRMIIKATPNYGRQQQTVLSRSRRV